MDITLAAEGVSLALIVASFTLMGFLALRARTIRSFQFQMFFVIAVLLVAEAPHILSDMGVINISGIEDFGLVVHTLSMAFLVVFVAIRASRYLKGGGSPER
jgi:hypothetical protein